MKPAVDDVEKYYKLLIEFCVSNSQSCPLEIKGALCKNLRLKHSKLIKIINRMQRNISFDVTSKTRVCCVAKIITKDSMLTS